MGDRGHRAHHARRRPGPGRRRRRWSPAWHDHWCTIVPESRRGASRRSAVTSESLLVLSSESAVSLPRSLRPRRHRTVEPIDLPELGSLAGLDGSRDRDEAFFSFTSFARPPDPVPLDARGDGRRLEPARATPTATATGRRATTSSSRSATRRPTAPTIPMFLIRAAGDAPGPDTPCVLTGYGGFAITMGPAYSAAVVAVCDDGGLYAVANIRGGAEEGEAWHRAGMREHKQQSFDDFLAAADWLVDQGCTSRDRLAIRGGSNGGLLMGAAITQRPDLCRAAQIAVPLLDMVRYHRFLHRPAVDPRVRRPRPARRVRLAATPTRRTTGSSTAPATPRCCSPPPRTTRGSTRCTPARWPPGCRRPRRAATTGPSCCARRPGRPRPGQAGDRSRPTSWPTSSPSSPGSSASTASAEPRIR